MTLRYKVEEIIINEVNEPYLRCAGIVRGAEYVAMKFFLEERPEDSSTKNIRKFLKLLEKDSFVDDNVEEA